VNTLNSSVETFATNLESLGGLIHTHTSSRKTKRDYIDLELFFLTSTCHLLNSDGRLVRCMEYWTYTFGKYLSPSRITKYIQQGIAYDGAVLGALLSIADSKFPRSGEFHLLIKFTKKHNNAPLLAFLKRVKNPDENWIKFGIIAPQFIPDEPKHFLRSTDYIIKNIPELSYRIKGYTIAIANINALLDLNGPLSVYKIAKITNSTYSYIHGIYNKHIKITRSAKALVLSK